MQLVFHTMEVLDIVLCEWDASNKSLHSASSCILSVGNHRDLDDELLAIVLIVILAFLSECVLTCAIPPSYHERPASGQSRIGFGAVQIFPIAPNPSISCLLTGWIECPMWHWWWKSPRPASSPSPWRWHWRNWGCRRCWSCRSCLCNHHIGRMVPKTGLAMPSSPKVVKSDVDSTGPRAHRWWLVHSCCSFQQPEKILLDCRLPTLVR